METLQLNETNYCDQQPVAIEFTFEEHDFLNDILCHASDGMYVACPNYYDLPEESEFRQRFKMLEEMRHKSNQLWKNRYGN
jgi:hypothetical protein